MQRVTNCILIHNNRILLLKKPRRGWYAIPGGKMEQGESIKESVVREFREETSLHLQEPEVSGVFTFAVHGQVDDLVHEWMMFTFVCHAFTGELTEHCDEGILEWVELDRIKDLPMAEGDKEIFKHVLSESGMLYGSFSYTREYELLDMRLDPSTS